MGRQLNSSSPDLIDTYLNGPRTLSNERLSYLMVSQPMIPGTLTPPHTPPLQTEPIDAGATTIEPHDLATAADPRQPVKFELLICATHFLGDGMALHQFGNDFFSLLGGAKTQLELEDLLVDEHRKSLKRNVDNVIYFIFDGKVLYSDAPPDVCHPQLFGRELSSNRGPISSSRWSRRPRKKLRETDCAFNVPTICPLSGSLPQQGGHTFPKASNQTRHTIVPTVPIDKERTKQILKTCKAHGVSISAAIFAICNMAWARTSKEKWTMPM